MHASNGESIDAHVYYQFVIKEKTLECTMFCAHDDEYAHEYLHGNNYWNINRSVVIDDAQMLVLACTEKME